MSAQGGRWELYNMADDRSELNDLSVSKPALIKELTELWYDVAQNVDHAPKNVLKPVTDKVPTFPTGSMTQRTAGPKQARDVESAKKRPKK